MENTPNLERLRQLAEHLLHGQLGHEVFDFSKYNSFGSGLAVKPSHICGTLGCAIGECPIVWRKDWRFDSDGLPQMNTETEVTASGMIWFNVNILQFAHLFVPCCQDPDFSVVFVTLYVDATKEQVANNILDFCQKIENELTGSN